MNINATCYRCGWEFGIETDEAIPAEHLPHICATCASVINLVVHEPEAPEGVQSATQSLAGWMDDWDAFVDAAGDPEAPDFDEPDGVIVADVADGRLYLSRDDIEVMRSAFRKLAQENKGLEQQGLVAGELYTLGTEMLVAGFYDDDCGATPIMVAIVDGRRVYPAYVVEDGILYGVIEHDRDGIQYHVEPTCKVSELVYDGIDPEARVLLGVEKKDAAYIKGIVDGVGPDYEAYVDAVAGELLADVMM